MSSLSNRTALVTGAGQGNGAAIARGLAAEGARVIATDINSDAARATADAIVASGGEAKSALLDVTSDVEAARLADDLDASGWAVDLLVNNAGICPRQPLESEGFQRAWELTMNINLNGVMNVSRAFLPHLKKKGGTIVNIASIAAFVSVPSTLAYMASKSGVKGLTQALAVELAPHGIRVNAIAPGQIATPMLQPSLDNEVRRRQIEAGIVLGRVGRPEELVGPAVFLSSEMSSFVTGVTLPVDGGFTAI
ncbi:3-oxoacyl-ACP reductase [Zhengella mangrovi]|uniref:3-oxoacyl-ACP reductase n=1 Tax=Zhengella mangrovi TaxID=1982044 RepID=A0A2G1QMT1_9HYPH|nr:SDR family oxidoreductase [Zhengella mangrovi]PHP66771.1 3-oxoacyl-ACP reductase [Zhengella mangrovi]